MGLEPRETVICCYLLLSAVVHKALKFQGFEAARLETAALAEMIIF